MKNNFTILFIGTFGVVASLACFTNLKAPPITFTQTQTSAEKQLVGEDKEIERDPWLISSIKTSSAGPDVWKRGEMETLEGASADKEYYLSLRTLSYTAPELRKLKEEGIAGEGLDGLVHWIPENKSKLDKKKEGREKFEELLKLINQSREKVNTVRLESEKKKNTEEKEMASLRVSIKNQFIEAALPGEYIETGKGKWIKKED